MTAALRTVDQVYEAGTRVEAARIPLTPAQVTGFALLLAACKPEAKAA